MKLGLDTPTILRCLCTYSYSPSWDVWAGLHWSGFASGLMLILLYFFCMEALAFDDHWGVFWGGGGMGGRARQDTL